MKNLILFDLTRADKNIVLRGHNQVDTALHGLSSLLKAIGSVDSLEVVLPPSYRQDFGIWQEQHRIWSSPSSPSVSFHATSSDERRISVKEGIEHGMEWIGSNIEPKESILWVLSYNNRFTVRLKDFSIDQPWRIVHGSYHVRFIAEGFEIRVVDLYALDRAAENWLGMKELLAADFPSIRPARELYAHSFTRLVEQQLLTQFGLELFTKAREAVFQSFRLWVRDGRQLEAGKSLFQHVNTAIHLSRTSLSRSLGIDPQKYHAFEASRAVVKQLILSGVAADEAGSPLSDISSAMSTTGVIVLVDGWEDRVLDTLAEKVFETPAVKERGITDAELSGLLFHSRQTLESRMKTTLILERLGASPLAYSGPSAGRFVLAKTAPAASE